MTEDMWITVTEGVERTGYNRSYIQRLARDNWNKPEGERLIQVRRASYGYMIWLPSLLRYIEEHGYGPYGSREKE